MPEKKDLYRSYGEKLISLFARLLFSGEEHFLIHLTRELRCSKQTVLRLVGDLRRAYGVEVEEGLKGNRKYYRLRRVGRQNVPVPPLTEMEMSVLLMCRAFAERLLGQDQFEKATQALLKSRALSAVSSGLPSRHFASVLPGTVDYTPHQETISTLVEAMNEKRVCRAEYQAIRDGKVKIHYIKPLKLFAHKDTVYLHAREARVPGEPFKEPEYDPLLAVHRFISVEKTDRLFEFPKDYDFEKAFNREFGVIKGKPFRVQVELTGWAARFASERIWSPNQKIKDLGEGKILLTFTASSEPEVVGWVLSMGDNAQLLKPRRLVKKLIRMVERILNGYREPENQRVEENCVKAARTRAGEGLADPMPES